MGVSSKFRLTCSALLALYFVGLIFIVVGLATDNWFDTQGVHTGLFRVCIDGFDCSKVEIKDQPDYMKAVIALQIIGLVFAVVGGATYMFVPLSGGFQIVAGLFVIISVGVFGGYNQDKTLGWKAEYLGFSFALSTLGGICVLANGITLLALMSQEDEGLSMDMVLPESSKIGLA